TDPESLYPALKNIDAVFLVWTAPPATAPAVIDRIAKNTSRLVFLTAPHQTPHPFFQQPNPLSAMLSGIERHIESTPLQSTFIRPGMFASNCIDWWGDAFRKNEVVRWPLLQAPTAPIDPRDIAAVSAHALSDPQSQSRAKSYVITGPESLTQLEQLQIIAATINRPLRYEDLTADEARQVLPFPLPAVNMLLDAWTAALGQPAYITTTVADLLGRPAHTFRAWAQHNASAFLPQSAAAPE
ncbi:MAG: NmrA family NAD(P)-binding protein, partial [Acidobacteria bacterium]|nr:NmrA family NAD(P)-binding protein [Acidobacteriota bacterium]